MRSFGFQCDVFATVYYHCLFFSFVISFPSTKDEDT